MPKKIQNLIDAFKAKIAAERALKDEKIRELEFKLKNSVKEDAVIFKMPPVIIPEYHKISNFPPLQKVEVVNPPKPGPEVQKVEVTNQQKAEPVVFPEVQRVEVTNPGEKASSWVPELITHAIKSLAKGLADRWDRGITIRTDDQDKLRPQAVIIVDRKGRPVDMNVPAPASMVLLGAPGGGRSGGVPIATVIGSGRQTVSSAGSAVQLLTPSTSCFEVSITALPSNVDAIYVGDSSVKAAAGQERGVYLGPSGSYTLKIVNVNKIFIDAVSSGDGVSFTYLS